MQKCTKTIETATDNHGSSAVCDTRTRARERSTNETPINLSADEMY